MSSSHRVIYCGFDDAKLRHETFICKIKVSYRDFIRILLSNIWIDYNLNFWNTDCESFRFDIISNFYSDFNSFLT